MQAVDDEDMGTSGIVRDLLEQPLRRLFEIVEIGELRRLDQRQDEALVLLRRELLAASKRT